MSIKKILFIEKDSYLLSWSRHKLVDLRQMIAMFPDFASDFVNGPQRVIHLMKSSLRVENINRMCVQYRLNDITNSITNISTVSS